jgi:ABC-2 type transport system ATP-binding protein
MTAEVLSIENLRKSYPIGFLHRRRRLVLDDLSLAVERGEVFGYLGPNGSGKTTTLKVLMGLVFADSGRLSILGRPLEDSSWRARVGYLPENPYFYDYLTAREYLDYAGRLFDLTPETRRTRTEELLKRVGLRKAADLAVRRFSKGMLQRLGIAQALVNDPELVFLDEPMSGLDPIGRHLVRNLILELKRAGKTVFFSTHILPDAETLCDRVALIRAGRLVDVGRLDQILKLDVTHVDVLVSGLDEAAVRALPAGVDASVALGDRWRLQVKEPAVGAVVRGVEERRGHVLSVQPIRQSLEEYFFKEMGGAEAGEEWVSED